MWWQTLLVVGAAAAVTKAVTLKKCCGSGESLTPGFTCTGSFISPVPCRGRHHLLLAEDADAFSLLSNGSLIHNNFTFPPSSFCADDLVIGENRSVSVIVLCPCTNITCTKKCCPSYTYLGENHRCVGTDEDVSRKPVFPGEHFQLVGRPQCDEGVYLLNRPKSQSPLEYWFLEDGKVAGHGLRDAIPLEDYCWDLTKDEEGALKPNLLYCKKWEGMTDSRERRLLSSSNLHSWQLFSGSIGLRPPQGSAMERDHKKFLFYSAYAWGVTEPAATLAYFYGPIAFVLVMNLALFLYTAARIIAVRRDTAILNSARNTSGSAVQKDRQRLILYVKLFCLMGLTWVTEIISWAVGGAEYYWYITDAVNMLRAVFIFVIFCCKRSVLHLLKVRLASFLPCSSELARGKSTTSYSGPTSSLRLSSVKKSVRRPSQDV
ncbi:hypothetical protein C0J52_08807 [Blattella germanica]|nr:hypothetical protein C0J52_08807 [Blattella germanica]